MKLLTRDGINNTQNSHRWSDKNPHAVVERNSQHHFSVNVCCGVPDNQLIGPAVLSNSLKGRADVDSAKRVSTIGEDTFG